MKRTLCLLLAACLTGCGAGGGASARQEAFPDLLSVCETVTANSPDGNHNMDRALRAVDGAVLEDGETFSFNAAVGPADAAHGYRKAGSLLRGELVQSFGGGICQAAATVYGAALRANMTVVERRSHSRPPAYCPIGLDAMIRQPESDLRFRNDTGHPVRLSASLRGTVLRVTFSGTRSEKYDRVEIISEDHGDKTATARRELYLGEKKISSGVLPESYYAYYGEKN